MLNDLRNCEFFIPRNGFDSEVFGAVQCILYAVDTDRLRALIEVQNAQRRTSREKANLKLLMRK